MPDDSPYGLLYDYFGCEDRIEAEAANLRLLRQKITESEKKILAYRRQQSDIVKALAPGFERVGKVVYRRSYVDYAVSLPPGSDFLNVDRLHLPFALADPRNDADHDPDSAAGDKAAVLVVNQEAS